MLPLYHVYVESESDMFTWEQCEKTMTNEMKGICHLYSRAKPEFDDCFSNDHNTSTASIGSSDDEDTILLKNKSLTMSNLETKQLFFVALPNNKEFEKWTKFWEFTDIDLNTIVGAIRIINPKTKQLSICVQFKETKFVQKCFYYCHGKRFFKNKTLICHTLFTIHVCYIFILAQKVLNTKK